ncbi:MAG: XTP/dITP diphosphatase [Candidatus Binatia bacterium]
MKLLVGTTNPGKFLEVEAALKDLPIRVVSLSTLTDWPKVVEDGETFEANAFKKARTLADFSGCMTLADDSGLEVDALGGAPGVFSARYSGQEGSDARNNEKLLEALVGLPKEKRGARFVCVLVLCSPGSSDREEWVFRGTCEGWISLAPRGKHGFGYDPIFFYPPFQCTFGQVDRATKGRVSHRGQALKKLRQALPLAFSLNTNP